jgi:hypothetical protein
MDEFADFHGDVAETQDPARIEQAARRFGLLPRDGWHFVTHLSTRCYTPNADPWTDKHRWLMLGTEACELSDGWPSACVQTPSWSTLGDSSSTTTLGWPIPRFRRGPMGSVSVSAASLGQDG